MPALLCRGLFWGGPGLGFNSYVFRVPWFVFLVLHILQAHAGYIWVVSPLIPKSCPSTVQGLLNFVSKSWVCRYLEGTETTTN